MTGPGRWQEMFEDRPSRPVGATERAMPVPDDIELAPDLSVYKPWTLQRGRSSPMLMLELRRYEARSGLWSGWQLSYPSLLATEFTGDRLLSLDFGSRHFVIEGRGLDELGRHLQQGSVVSVQEHASDLWPTPVTGPWVKAIRAITPSSDIGQS